MSPMKSKAQRRTLWAKDPKVARRFERHTPKGRRLPEHKRRRRKRRSKK